VELGEEEKVEMVGNLYIRSHIDLPFRSACGVIHDFQIPLVPPPLSR
jgi:hypothetical protein